MYDKREKMLEFSERSRLDGILVKQGIERILKPFSEETGLTVLELDLLMFLSFHPDKNTATEYIQAKRAAKSNVSTSVSHLEKEKYLIRQQRKENKKTIDLILTEQGLKLGTQAGECAMQEFSHLGDGISIEEYKHFINVYRKMEENLKKIAEGGK